MRMPGGWAWITAGLCGLAGSSATAQEHVDLLLYNGKVFTADATKSIHQAVAIRSNRIAAVGSNRMVERYSALRSVDLQGRLVTPGFIDTHTSREGQSQALHRLCGDGVDPGVHGEGAVQGGRAGAGGVDHGIRMV